MSIRKTLSLACGVAILAAYAVGFVRYAPVFHDEGSLWLHVLTLAPNKPRPHVQLALALIERHRFPEAQAVLDDLDAVLQINATLPPYDLAEGKAALLSNRLLLSRAAGTGGWRRN